MEQILSLPLRRKACGLRLGFNPRTRVPEASMLTTRPPKPSTRTKRFRKETAEVLVIFNFRIVFLPVLP
jgi:hypothetical protein